jgi:tetratricopeptide (TPR) repeat protein
MSAPDEPVAADSAPDQQPVVSVEASGDRSVALGRDLTNSAVVTGDHNQVTIDQREIYLAVQAGVVEIEVEVGASAPDGTAPVRARGPARAEPVRGTLRLPFSDLELQLGAMWAEQGADDEQVRQVGEQLFRALFAADLAEVYREARASTAPLRLRLTIESARLARVPWELLYDPERGEYLAVDATVVRGSTARRRAQPRHIVGPVRVLLLDLLTPGAAGPQLSAASVARELRRLVRLRQLTLTTEAPRSLDAVASTLEAAPDAASGEAAEEPAWHVLHLLATARLDPESGQPILGLGGQEGGQEDDQDDEQFVDADTLASLVQSLGDVPVVVTLAASTRTPATVVAAAFGPALLDAGAPAVVFLPTAELSKRAGRALRELYDTLVEGQPLDMALRDAWQLRRERRTAGAPALGRPVCFLRPGSGQLLDVEPAEPLELTRHPASWWLWLQTHASPVRVAVSACLLLLTLAALVILSGPVRDAFAAPTPMTGFFNVAVTALQFDSEGCQFPASLARDLSGEWFTQLEPKVRALSQGAPYRASYYDRSILDENRLRAFGEAVQADAVVLGELSCELNRTVVTPQVYLTGRSMVDRDAGELVGLHQLGAPIVEVGNPQVDQRVYSRIVASLAERATLTATLVSGLAAYPSGDWERAEQAFDAAIAGLSGSAAGSPAHGDSMPVLYLFQGKVASQQRQWPEARTAYETALQLKPDYLRARLGLAEVEYHQAAEASSQGGAACLRGGAAFELTLRQLIATYEEAIRGIPEPDVGQLRMKAHYYLGRTYACLGLARQGEDAMIAEDAFGRAEAEYRVVTGTYEAARDAAAGPWCRLPLVSEVVRSCTDRLNAVVQNWAADAYAGRGFILLRSMQLRGYTADTAAAAEQLYTAALNLSTNQTQRGGYALQVAVIHRGCGRLAHAAAALSTAIVLDPTRAPTFERLQRSLTPVPPPPGVAPTATPAPC